MTTRRISISVPEDVARRLDEEANASAFITNAVRARMKREQIRKVLADAGIEITPEGVAAMRERIRDLERRRAARLAAS